MVAVGFLNLGFGPPALVDASETSLPLYPSLLGELRRLELPEVGAAAFAIVDGSTGALLAGQESHRRLPPASTTKIATAIVALERGRLEDLVKVDVDSQELADSSLMGLVPGDTVSLRDLLYGLLLPSGNDAAIAIARHIAGSEERFVLLMNAKVEELGLKNTHFVNPHGLDDPNHYSSAFDLSMLARYAMNNPVFATIVSTREYTAAGQLRRYQMYNTNHLLFRYAGVDGVKTGYHERALQTLVASASRDGRRVYATVLGSNDRIGDTIPLLDYYFANFATGELDLRPSPLSEVAGPQGGLQRLRATPAPEVTLPAWQFPFVRPVVWLDGEVPAKDGAMRLGFVAFYLGERLLAEAPVYGR